jgi:hypothetical protein
VPLVALERTAIENDVAAALARVPTGPGVGQILDGDGRSLLTGTASSLRRWAAGHLGKGKPKAPGKRPRTDLAPVAAAIAWVEVDSPFRQRLVYERVMAPLVPLASRRDLKPPAFLHLDPTARFPRVAVRATSPDRSRLFGPFRDRRAAERAREAVHRAFPLRPCDYAFEPDPQLALGLGCVFAQVRSCAAPCLGRVSEAEYRSLAGRAAAWLAGPGGRPDAPEAVPPLVGLASSARAVVVDPGRRTLRLFPVRGGRVVEGDAAVVEAAADLPAAVAALRWEAASEGPDDWPWMLAWLRSPKARALFLGVAEDEPPESLAARVRAVLPARFGDNVGRSRGQA